MAKGKKPCGASHRKYVNRDGEERHLVLGWRYTRKHGLVSYRAVTTKDSVLSDKGWFGSVAVTLTIQDTGQKSFYWGTMQEKTGKVVINDLAQVINPSSKNGGYCGTYINNEK